jgi:DNA mismatch repair ATPase MutS
VLKTADHSATELALISEVLLRFEREEFEAPLLLALRRRLETDGEPPSKRLKRLVRLGQLVDAGRNQLFLPFALLLLWHLQCAFALERWRRTSGEHVGDWLRAVGEIEALLSIAGYAFERPEDPFPEIATEGPEITATGIGHPLLPVSRCIRNDLTLAGDLRLIVISGSNMSGKSTLLRTVGTNAVLAFLGAPVTAESLRISPLTLGASLRVVDSLLEGRSRFYAEITRLKQVVDLTDGDRPVLFLLDELLHGTNSKDRAAGAKAIVGGLVERGAIGLVTTHDLALSAIAESPDSRAANHHFEDRMEGDEMIFDYRLRPGVVTRSNALALMRAIGLDV